MRRIARPSFCSQIEVLETRTLPTTLIALIDTGLNPSGINPAYRSYLDMSDAYNAVDGSNNVSDTNGHGTSVAGYIAQEIQIASSVMGVSPSVEILPIKDDVNGAIPSNAIINGVEYAISKGASVINLSIEGGVPVATSQYGYIKSLGENLWTAITDASRPTVSL